MKLAAVIGLADVTFLALLIVKFPRGIVPPTTPVKAMSPVPAARFRFCCPEIVPSIVLLKVMEPLLPLVLRDTRLLVRVMEFLKLMLLLIMFPPRETLPIPLALKAPAKLIFVAGAIVSSPPLVIVKPLLLLMSPVKLKMLPIRLISPTVSNAP